MHTGCQKHRHQNCSPQQEKRCGFVHVIALLHVCWAWFPCIKSACHELNHVVRVENPPNRDLLSGKNDGHTITTLRQRATRTGPQAKLHRSVLGVHAALAIVSLSRVQLVLALSGSRAGRGARDRQSLVDTHRGWAPLSPVQTRRSVLEAIVSASRAPLPCQQACLRAHDQSEAHHSAVCAVPSS